MPQKDVNQGNGAKGNRYMSKTVKTRTNKTRINKMRRLSTMIDPMIAPSAKARGFAIGRILSQWHDIVGDMASWCRPDAVSFPHDSRIEGTLRLQIVSGRGPQAQAMSDVIIDRVNAHFGYQAINRISLIQTLSIPLPPTSQNPNPLRNKDPQDIWALDDKLKNIRSPKLRAALRRLGSPIDDPGDTDTTSYPALDTQRLSD
jgi:hypothetical protein